MHALRVNLPETKQLHPYPVFNAILTFENHPIIFKIRKEMDFYKKFSLASVTYIEILKEIKDSDPPKAFLKIS